MRGIWVALVFLLAGCTAPPSPTPTPEPPCFAGTWRAEDGAFAGFVEAVLTTPSIATEHTADVEGEAFLTFTATRYSYRPSASFTIHWPFGNQEGTISGESTGTWFQNGGTLLTRPDDPDYPGISVRTTIVGDDMQDAPDHVLGGVPILSSDVECDGDRVTATFGLDDVVMPLTFDRIED